MFVQVKLLFLPLLLELGEQTKMTDCLLINGGQVFKERLSGGRRSADASFATFFFSFFAFFIFRLFQAPLVFAYREKS